MIVVGIGCRKGATAEAIGAAIDAAVTQCGLQHAQIDALATAAGKSGEPGIVGAARVLAARLIFVSLAQMQHAAGASLSTSALVMDLKGVPSVAETSALAAAGLGAKLLAPRVLTDSVACAIAVSEGT